MRELITVVTASPPRLGDTSARVRDFPSFVAAAGGKETVWHLEELKEREEKKAPTLVGLPISKSSALSVMLSSVGASAMRGEKKKVNERGLGLGGCGSMKTFITLTVHHHVDVELLDVGDVRLHAGEGVLVAQLDRRQQQAEVVQQAHAVLVVVGGADRHVLAPQLEQQVARHAVLFDLEGAGGQSRGHPHGLRLLGRFISLAPSSLSLLGEGDGFLICRPGTQTGRGSDMTSGCQTVSLPRG